MRASKKLKKSRQQVRLKKYTKKLLQYAFKPVAPTNRASRRIVKAEKLSTAERIGRMKITNLPARWLAFEDPSAFLRTWYPVKLSIGEPARFAPQMDFAEALARAVDQYPEWRERDQ